MYWLRGFRGRIPTMYKYIANREDKRDKSPLHSSRTSKTQGNVKVISGGMDIYGVRFCQLAQCNTLYTLTMGVLNQYTQLSLPAMIGVGAASYEVCLSVLEYREMFQYKLSDFQTKPQIEFLERENISVELVGGAFPEGPRVSFGTWFGKERAVEVDPALQQKMWRKLIPLLGGASIYLAKNVIPEITGVITDRASGAEVDVSYYSSKQAQDVSLGLLGYVLFSMTAHILDQKLGLYLKSEDVEESWDHCNPYIDPGRDSLGNIMLKSEKDGVVLHPIAPARDIATFVMAGSAGVLGGYSMLNLATFLIKNGPPDILSSDWTDSALIGSKMLAGIGVLASYKYLGEYVRPMIASRVEGEKLRENRDTPVFFGTIGAYKMHWSGDKDPKRIANPISIAQVGLVLSSFFMLSIATIGTQRYSQEPEKSFTFGLSGWLLWVSLFYALIKGATLKQESAISDNFRETVGIVDKTKNKVSERALENV